LPAIVIEYKKIELDYCTNCRGVWFDSGEMELLLEKAGLENNRLFWGDIVQQPEAPLSEKKRKCPICGRKMKKAFIDRENKILIDICRNEHGIWFDGGELEKLLGELSEESPDKAGPHKKVISFLGDTLKSYPKKS
jgi:hypothetical protein